MLSFFFLIEGKKKTKKNTTRLLQYLLYCGGLEMNLQNLWGLPVVG